MNGYAPSRRTVLLAGLALAAAGSARAQTQAPNWPTPREGVWTARDFRFHTGDVFPELRLAYTTVGEPTGAPVLILHGTGGSGRGMLSPNFAGQLFGPGQPLDAQRHFIILPDSIGAGRSSKPSDGMKASFPRYNFDDMVLAQHRLVTEGLGIPKLRLVLGNSMGGMHAWLWATRFPDAMEAVVPMASQPTAMASRNWMLRRLMVEQIRRDPAYAGGNYTSQPESLRQANVFYATATNGGTLNLQATAPTREAADRIVEQRLGAPITADANDFVYQWDSSRDYDPEPNLGRIKAKVLLINSADDERNPPETGVTEAALKKVPGARLHLIPASTRTTGHGTTGNASFWADELRRFLQEVG